MKYLKKIALLMCMFMLLVCCTSKKTEKTIVKGTGTIKYLDFEGGFYGIIADNGKCYDPVNLPSKFAQDGLRVQFKARVRSDLVRHTMWGIIVELVYIDLL